MIDVILDTADRRGYQLMLFVTRGQPEKERRCLECLIRSQVDGVLYQPQLDPDLPLAQELCRIRYPLILFGQRSSQFATAWSDCRVAIRDAVREVCRDGEKSSFLPDISSPVMPNGLQRPGGNGAQRWSCIRISQAANRCRR